MFQKFQHHKVFQKKRKIVIFTSEDIFNHTWIKKVIWSWLVIWGSHVPATTCGKFLTYTKFLIGTSFQKMITDSDSDLKQRRKCEKREKRIKINLLWEENSIAEKPVAQFEKSTWMFQHNRGTRKMQVQWNIGKSIFIKGKTRNQHTLSTPYFNHHCNLLNRKCHSF